MLLAAALLVVTALRLWHAGRIGLSPDEAYYRLWSQHLDLGYYSKGPAVAWAIRAGTSLAGDTVRGVRLLAPLLALVTTLLAFDLGRRLAPGFGGDGPDAQCAARRTGLAAAVALNALPIFNAGALLMTIDPLSIAAWAGALATTLRALEPGRRRPLAWWAATGLLAGAGILAKPVGLAWLAGLALFVALSGSQRRRLLPGAVLAAAVAGAVTAPLAWWNASHGWITARHLVERGGLDGPLRPQPSELAELVAAHLGAWSPILFVLVLAAVPGTWRVARSHLPTRLVLCVSLPVLALYLGLGLLEGGEANWTAPGLFGLLLLAAARWTPEMPRSRALRGWAATGLLLGAVLSVAGVETDLVRAAGFELPARLDPSSRLRGWPETAALVERERRELAAQAGSEPFLIAGHYGTAAELAFWLRDLAPVAPGHPPVTTRPGTHVHDQFGLWPGPWSESGSGRSERGPYLGRPALVVQARSRPPTSVPEAPADVASSFASCELVAIEPVTRRGDVLRTLVMHACRGFGDDPAP